MELKRILSATDFSRTADAAMRRAALLAKASGASLELVHSIFLPPLAETWLKLIQGEGITEASVRVQAEQRLAAEATDLARRTGVTPVTRVLSGKPAAMLAQWARENAADLIVVGSHGEHFLLDLFVGTTALKLLRLATVPVLLVKQPPPFDYENVLIATDFSPASRTAANLAAHLLPRADLQLFHAFETPFERQMYYAGTDDEAVDHYRRLGESEARRQMDEFVLTLDDPARFARKVRHGYAPALINQHAAEMGADLLVLGSNRQSDVEATLLGSVAAHLVNEARGDLLLVPLSV